MPTLEVQEAKGVIAAIVKENGTTKTILDEADANIVYTSGGFLVSMVFLECATSYSQDSSKTVNKQDVVGTQTQKISEGSVEDTFTYDAIAIEPNAFGDRTIDVIDNPYHGLDGSVNTQYIMTPHGFRQAFRGGNTFTVRLFYGCSLDANEDADVTTATEVIDLERVHMSSNNTSASGGSDITLSVSFDAETVSFPAAWNSAPN